MDACDGKNFGFDSIVLRENNLRIFFDDTTTSATYPSNDWRIKVNDSETNGASYFAIEDATAGKTPFKILAGAPDNAVYVNDQGLGLNTSDPRLDFQM